MSEMKKEFKPVNMNGEEFLLWFNGNVVEHGCLDTIKEYIGGKMSIGNEVKVEEFEITLNNPLEGVTIEYKNEVKVEMNDDKYSEEEVEYAIINSKTSRELETFSYENDAIEHLAHLIEQDDTDFADEKFTLIRKVEYMCTYDVDRETVVDIHIPNQEVEVTVIVEQPLFNEQSIQEVPANMSDEEIEKELLEMYARLQSLSEEKNKRSSILRPGLMPKPLSQQF